MTEERNRELTSLLKSFDMAMECNPEDVSKRNQTLYMPNIKSTTFQQLFDSVRNMMYDQSSVRYIDPPCIIFGDLHGHFVDIIRIIKKFGFPTDKKFVFLGDIIDRGEFSIETITYIFLLKYFYKENVIIIRGNHEFQNVFTSHGFFEDTRKYSFSHSAVVSMARTLEYLPFACVVGNKYICMHGGIGPSVTLDGIKKIKLPCETFDEQEIVQDIVWSDPMEEGDGFKKSPRGKGHLFGKDVLTGFLSANNFSCLIRAHEKTMGGVESLFDGKLLTVFSASNYCGNYNNFGGAISINSDLSYEITKFEPLEYLLRCHTLSVDEYLHKKTSSDSLLKFQKSLHREQASKPHTKPNDKSVSYQWEQSKPQIPSIILKKLVSKSYSSVSLPPTVKFGYAKLQREQKKRQDEDQTHL